MKLLKCKKFLFKLIVALCMEIMVFGMFYVNEYKVLAVDENDPALTPAEAEGIVNANSDSDDMESSDAFQGGKLLTPIMDLIVSIGDGIMHITQKAITGTSSEITLDFTTKIFSIIIGIIAAIAVIALVTLVTGGIGTFVSGLVGASTGLASILTTIASSSIVTTIVTGITLGAGGLAYNVATSTFNSAFLPDITVFPTYSIGPEEIFKGELLIFDVNFFNPKDVYVHTKNGSDKKVSSYNEATDGEADYYYYKDGNNKIVTSKQNTASDLSNAISKWYYAIRNVAIVIMMLILVYIGIRMMLCSIASEKSKYKKMLGDWVVSICLVFVLQYIMIFAININESIVKLIKVSIDSNMYTIGLADVKNKKNFVKTVEKNDELKQGLIDANGNNLYNENGESTGAGEAVGFMWPTNLVGQVRMMSQMKNGTSEYIGYCIAFIVLVFYTIFFAFTYIKRVIYLAFLSVIAPLVAMTYSLDKISDGKAQAFNMWLKEYIFNLLIQPVHLMLYLLLISMSFDLASNNIIYTLVAIGFMMPAEKLIRSMFGFNKATTPGFLGGATGAALTMSALSGMNKFAGKGKGQGQEQEKSPKFAGNNRTADKGFKDLPLGEQENNPSLGDATVGNKSNGAEFNIGDVDNDTNQLPDYEDIRLAEENADTSDFLDDEDRRKYDILTTNENLKGEGVQNLRNDLQERANRNKKAYFDKQRNERRLLEESKRIAEQRKASQSWKTTSARIMKNKWAEVSSKDNLKNTVAKTVKGGVKFTGAAVGAGIGAAAGIAAGDMNSVMKNAGLGAAVGNSLASGAANKSSVLKDNYDKAKTEYQKEKLGEDYQKWANAEADKKWAKSAETKQKFAQAFSTELAGLKGKEYDDKLNEFINIGKEYRSYGSLDDSLNIKAMKLNRGDKANPNSIAAAMMASKAKDMDSLEKYQQKLAKQVGEARAQSISDNAAKIGGIYK